MRTDQVKKFEVFVYPVYDGFIGDNGFTPDLTERKSIMSQLLNGLQQLKNVQKCHNNLKPSNILYRKTITSYEIRIADFGQCGGKGGTPGWTAPIFNKERKPGKEDMYSVGWLILKLLCDDKDLFLCLRDNFVTDTSKPWMAKFRNLPEIQILLKMINIENQPTVETIIDEWNKIKSGVSLIQRSNLLSLGVPQEYLQLQYDHPE